MKLEVGMYVRFNRGGIKIAKLIENINDSQFWKLDIHQDILEGDILKASYNIIDLIEVGDVITTNNMCGEITSIDKENDEIHLACFDYDTISSVHILSIVTKEQFERVSYKLGNGDE